MNNDNINTEVTTATNNERPKAVCLEKRITKHGGPSMSQRYTFEAVFDGNPVNGEVADAQRELGYHPAGYGMTTPTITPVEGTDHYRATWQCWGSCD